MIDFLQKDKDDEYSLDDYSSWLWPFTPGLYYVADESGYVLGEYASYGEAKAEAGVGDVVLIAVKPIGKNIEDTLLPPPPKKCDKIVIDFDKKELTIGDKDVTIALVNYEKDSIYDLEDDDIADWKGLLTDAWRVAEAVEVLGTPPIDGKDITDEMSDL